MANITYKLKWSIERRFIGFSEFDKHDALWSSLGTNHTI